MLQKIERKPSVSGSQQFRIETKRLPISLTQAVMSSRIVPSVNQAASISDDVDHEVILITSDDETDALMCKESLPLPQPSCSGDNTTTGKMEGDKDIDVVHIDTAPASPPRQLYRFSNHFGAHFGVLKPVLPQMYWANPYQMWDILDCKEDKYPRSPDMLRDHPLIKCHMRPVLYAWLTEVSEMYKLHKETYYLAVEYMDRYLLFTHSLKPSQLQLIGITALFLAAKNEEVYPPKVQDFAYVCDGAYDENSILKFEIDMLHKLKWMLSPLTPHMWIQIFLQVHCIQQREAARRCKASPTFATPSSCPAEPASDHVPSTSKRSRSSTERRGQDDHSDRGSTLMDLAACALATDSPHTLDVTQDMGAVHFSPHPINLSLQDGRGGSLASEEMGVINLSLDSVGTSDLSITKQMAADDEPLSAEEKRYTKETGGVNFPACCEEGKEGDICECSDIPPLVSDSETESCGDDIVDDLLKDVYNCSEGMEEEEVDITYPIYSPFDYLQACRLLDSAILDKHSLRFRYKVIAACAVYLTTDVDNICNVSGLSWEQMQECLLWLRIHHSAIERLEPEPVTPRQFEGFKESDAHLIQCSIIRKNIWEEVLKETDNMFHPPINFHMLIQAVEEERQKHHGLPTTSFITPPRSCKKSKRQ